MTIRKGANWGRQIARPDNLVYCNDDTGASILITNNLLKSLELPTIAIRKSNLARVLGIDGAKVTPDTTTKVLSTLFDLIRVDYLTVKGTPITVFGLGYALLRNSWWHGEIVAVLNESFIGDWDCAPRAHPNDGKLDVVIVSSKMKPSQRLLASRRVRSGTHIPHPGITIAQQTYFETTIGAPKMLIVDGRQISTVKACEFTVIPDAVTLCW
ncbi:MAG: hypothetical protein HQ486_02410 [Acidimicrobiaceae bacterium]|nr:hypothetical protein [Acidimicrobiaceae bacterium]